MMPSAIAAREVQLELRAEKQHCDIVQLQETVPFVDAGSPERDREREAQDELGQRWQRNGADNGIHSFKEHTNFVPFAAAANLPFDSHRPPPTNSPRRKHLPRAFRQGWQ